MTYRCCDIGSMIVLPGGHQTPAAFTANGFKVDRIMFGVHGEVLESRAKSYCILTFTEHHLASRRQSYACVFNNFGVGSRLRKAQRAWNRSC